MVYIIRNFPPYSVDILVMKLKYLVFVVCYFALLGEIGAPSTVGPLGNIVMHSIYECTGDDKPKGDEMKVKINFKEINDNGDKALDLEYENKIALDDTTNYIIDIKKFENGGWSKFYNLKGKPCEDFNKFMRKLWGKVTGALVPKIAMNCPIQPGTYKLTDFKSQTNDIEAKSIFYGKLLVNLTIMKKGKIVLCVMGEADSQSPK